MTVLITINWNLKSASALIDSTFRTMYVCMYAVGYGQSQMRSGKVMIAEGPSSSLI